MKSVSVEVRSKDPGPALYPSAAASLTNGRVLVRNTIWNVGGTLGPAIAAAVCIPLLARTLGADRFGLLSLAWVVVGYFSLFDFGLGKALTKAVAEHLGQGEHEHVFGVVRISMILLITVGGAVGAIFATLAHVLVARIMHIPPALQAQSVAAVYVLSVTVPFVVTAAGLRGVLEAHQKFAVVNGIRVPLGVWMFAGPAILLPFTKNLAAMCVMLLVGRVMACLALAWFCAHIVRRNKISDGRKGTRGLSRLLRDAGWMTITNVVSPILSSVDRFVIGAILDVAAVGIYTGPYEAITKLQVVPGSIMGVLFPAFSATVATDSRRTAKLYRMTLIVTFVLLFPVALAAVFFAREALSMWLGTAYARTGYRVLQYLAVGVLLNGIAQAPFGLVQGAGRADWAAKLHLVEVACYLPLLYFLVVRYGIEGAAIAWSCRAAVDAAVFFVMAHNVLPRTGSWRLGVTCSIAFIALLAGCLQLPLATRATMFVVIVAVTAFVCWFFLFDRSDRQLLLAYGHPAHS